jgi:formyl-CoA transferase
MENPMNAPLEGIRVLDLGISTAGPYAARFLADLGADVIKVEPVDGENSRTLGLRYGDTGYLYHVNNYNKKAVTLQVQHPKGRALFLKLVADADVVIENFALGTMTKWGIGYEACRKANPSIVYCSAKGFGERGRLKEKKAFDTVTQALSGIMSATGRPDDGPLKGGPSVCDLMTAYASSMAIVSAIAARKKGVSTFLDTSLFDLGALSLVHLWPWALSDKPETTMQIADKHPLHAPFGSYPCASGSIFLTVTEDEQWRSLAPHLSLPAQWSRVERKSKESEIDRAIVLFLLDRSAMDAASLIQALGVPAAPILDLSEVTGLPVMTERQLIAETDHPDYGRVPLIRSPFIPASQPAVRRLQPTLGQHNDEILGSHLSDGESLPDLRQQGVIG